jgi:hypothetical protein
VSEARTPTPLLWGLRAARSDGEQVVAEGIEQLADLRVLQDLGIPFGQGYLLGRPTAAPLCAKVSWEESVVHRPPLRTPQTALRERVNTNSARLNAHEAIRAALFVQGKECPLMKHKYSMSDQRGRHPWSGQRYGRAAASKTWYSRPT